jgi:hypothetical protein
MIELDREEAHAETITRAGGHPIGERSGLVWFTDPATKSTHVLEPHQVTEFNVILKLAQSRMRFAGGGMISRFYRGGVSESS